jgi:hypothetical protein
MKAGLFQGGGASVSSAILSGGCLDAFARGEAVKIANVCKKLEADEKLQIENCFRD